MSLDDLTAQSGGWQSHPDNPVGGRSRSSSSSGGRSRSFRKGDPCPICDQADKRCSVTEQGLYRCWNFRTEGDRSDYAWRFRKLATSSYGGEWGCWVKANHCDRCGTEDSRCWKKDQGIYFCANSLQGLVDAGNWQFLGQSNGKKGQLWGKWQSTNWVPQKLPTVKQISPRIISPRPAEDPQTPSPVTNPEPDQLLETHAQALWRPIHHWIWDLASSTLHGRFIDKLSTACIDDTSYSRYLTSQDIEVILQTLDERVASGEWSTELVLASGWFSENKGFDSTFRFKTSLRPGRVIACFDIEGQFDQLRANPEVPLVKRKRIKGNKVKLQQIKYQQAAGIPTRPYFPKAAQQLRTHLQQTSSPYLLQITEGEDKAECMAQNFPTLLDGTPVLWVSMAGVWNFAGTGTDLHPELATLVDGAIGVGIAFDSDVQSKKEVRQAMERLASRIIERTDGTIIPLAADWRGLLGEQKQLATHTERWGLDDLWGVLTQSGHDPASAIDRLVSPRYARMVRRWWHRKAKAWNADDQPDLLSLEDARTAVRQTVRDWFSAGLSTLRSASSDRIALAATCGVGKTTATMQELVEHVQRWWFAQIDPIQFQLWSELADDILNSQVSTPGALFCWLTALNEVVQLALDSFPPPGTLSEAANEVLLLHQKLTRLEVKKAASLPDTPERWAVLSEMRAVREQLESIYHQGLGGSLLLVFKDRKALFDSLADHVLPAANSDGQLPPWLALRTGREALEPQIPTREQVAPGSLACAHHEAVADLGSNRHSPSAGACQHCYYGQQGTCGFLDSLSVAHRMPVVFATIQAVLNASHELESFEQVVCDEALDTHLVETLEISRAIKLLVESLQRGQAGGWYTLPPLYTEEQIQALVAVFGEIQSALARFNTATDEEHDRLGTRLVDWCDKERIAPYLVLLKDLKPLRWNRTKLEVESASYFPWERPRYTIDPVTNQPLHTLTYGEDQKIGFEFIPLRATSEILNDLYEAVILKRPGEHLTLERKLVESTASTRAGEVQEEANRKHRRTLLHLVRPQYHLIKALRSKRVLNLDATPNEKVLEILLPDMQVVKVQAKWQNTKIIQVLSGPMGRATSSTIKQVLPLAAALGTDASVLMFSHKKHTQQVDEAQATFQIPGLLTANDAAGNAHSMAWYGYQDRAIDDPIWKQTDYLILSGAHRTNIGHSSRLAGMLRRFMATDKNQTLQNAPAESPKPYRFESYGPEGYELVVENQDPLLDALIEHERIASLEQACQRPRPVSRDKPLTIILMRSDPMSAPYNRYVSVVDSVEELMGVTHPGGNRANYARQLEALARHSQVIWQWFVKFHTLPNPRQVEAFGKTLYGVGGHRGNQGAIKQALALFAAQLLPSLQANENIAESRAQFLEDLAVAAAEHFDVNVCTAELNLSPEAREAYWIERYRQGDTHTRLVCWVSTRHLGESLKQSLEAIQPIYEVLKTLRNDIERRRKTAGDESGP